MSMSLAGKTAIVTGASSGIGKVTARELARMGARVLLVCRDPVRGRAAADEIAAVTGTTTVELAQCDLASQASIRTLGEELTRRCPRIDLLINNAGGIQSERAVTVDGIETTFATNHLGPFLLTRLLLDRIRASAPARIVTVASAVHAIATIRFDDLQLERGYRPMKAYAQSKLANLLFTSELARRLTGSGVTANCLHPGAVASRFGGSGPGWMRFGVRMARPFMISSERGARTSIYLASSPEVEGVSGRYFVACRERQPSARARDEAAATQLWEVSARLTGLAG
jgi:NAD(P)-dependent dehydrogenase (short-subunit alcohol dehydrogenase family)